ncbi:MAG: hypothetical protein ABFS56_18290 [Pseudomonadota bacterium]
MTKPDGNAHLCRTSILPVMAAEIRAVRRSFSSAMAWFAFLMRVSNPLQSPPMSAVAQAAFKTF